MLKSSPARQFHLDLHKLLFIRAVKIDHIFSAWRSFAVDEDILDASRDLSVCGDRTCTPRINSLPAWSAARVTKQPAVSKSALLYVSRFNHDAFGSRAVHCILVGIHVEKPHLAGSRSAASLSLTLAGLLAVQPLGTLSRHHPRVRNCEGKKKGIVTSKITLPALSLLKSLPRALFPVNVSSVYW